MAINMMCMNDKCKYYWEDNCMRNMNEERIEIDESGKCVTFERGINEAYGEYDLKQERTKIKINPSLKDFK